jgi:hypothetical protein
MYDEFPGHRIVDIPAGADGVRRAAAYHVELAVDDRASVEPHLWQCKELL